MSLPLDEALRQCDRHARGMQRPRRTALTHEYLEQVTWQAQALNHARTMGLQLIAWLTRLKLEFELRKTP